LILRAVSETKGTAIAVDDREIISSMKSFFRSGIYACPEAASTLAALNKVEDEGIFPPDEKILLYLTGTAMKYLDVMRLDKHEIHMLDKDAHRKSTPDRSSPRCEAK